MSDESKKAERAGLRIVVGLAFTDADGAAFDQAARIARSVPHSDLQLIHVFDKAPDAANARDLVNHLRLYVNEKAAESGGLKAMSVGIHLRSGKPARAIAQFAADISANLIVIGAHKHPHLKSWVVGTTAEHLVATAPCPVLLAPPKAKTVPAHEPAIEPACPDCLSARASSKGKSWWCERHAHHAKQAHQFSYQRELPFATHDSEVIPTGVQF